MKKSTQEFQNRQILKSDTFEIFHYRDEKPKSVSVHHHDFYEIYLFLGGQVSYRVEGKTYRLEIGDLLLINPEEMHQPYVTSDMAYERIVLWINRNFLDKICLDGVNLKACFENKADNRIHPESSTTTRLIELMKMLTHEYYSDDFGGSAYSVGLFYQIMVEINRLAQRGDKFRKQEKPDLITKVVAYINKNYSKPITLDALAKEFFVSKYYLSHEFTRYYGTSVYKYIILKRLLIAKEKIAEGMPIGEVYKLCGFGDYTTFFRAFKAEYGINPREFANSLIE